MKKLFLLLFLLLISFKAYSGGIVRDSEIENYIKRLVTPITKSANLDTKSLKIILINDKQINAFVTPGQKIFIFTGLILNSTNHNQIEGVLSHELGHITGRHHLKIYNEIEKSRIINIVGLITGLAATMATGDSRALPTIAGAAQSTSQRTFLSFSRAQEGSADQAGFRFLKKSNKSICGTVEFLRILEKKNVSNIRNEYLLTHPLTSNRINDAINASKNENCEKIKYSKDEINRLKFIQAKLIGFSNPENTINIIKNYDFNDDQKKYALSISNFKLFNFDKGVLLINSLIKKYPKNPYFYELKAQMLRENGYLKESVNYYNKSLSFLPYDPLIMIEMSHSLINLEDKNYYNEIVNNLEKAKLEENENQKLWYLLSIVHGRNGQLGKSRFASAYSYFLKGDDNMALNFIKRAKKVTIENSKDWNKLINLENKISLKNNK